ncbi:MAG TPA: hypothetical protein VFJ24_09505 [Gaiellales bacterium]|nr:hypothetical protein [Gaiellales bacterium]
MQYPRFHEAAHVIAHQRGINDTSRQGRYHNNRFRGVAQEIGLQGEVPRDPVFGWSLITPADRTRIRYGDTLAELEATLPAVSAPSVDRPRTQRPTAIEMSCRCGARIRSARAALHPYRVICGVCRTSTVVG